MVNKLRLLARLLRNCNLPKFANRIEEIHEYAEPWHEEAVKEFGSEPISEDEYLDKIIYQDPPVKIRSFRFLPPRTAENILLKHGIRPVSAGEKLALIGAGSFGLVFRAIYRSKPVVAKLITNAGTRNFFGSEINKWELIKANLDLLPPEYQKHLPKIYDLIRGNLQVEYTVGNMSSKEQLFYENMSSKEQLFYEIIVMEELHKLPEFLSLTDIPLSFDSYEFNEELYDKLNNIPETKTLLETLVSLKSKLGLRWDDLHNNNLMLGSDGNIKIIDLGLFRM